MILTRSADYALRAMIHLARENNGRYVTLNEIASRMRTPPFLTGRLLQQLVHGGLLVSMKGHHGGFHLLKPANEITAAEIIEAIDGPFVVFNCSGIADCGLSGPCSLVEPFAQAGRAIREVFAAVSLDTLVRQAEAPCGTRGNVAKERTACAETRLEVPLQCSPAVGGL